MQLWLGGGGSAIVHMASRPAKFTPTAIYLGRHSTLSGTTSLDGKMSNVEIEIRITITEAAVPLSELKIIQKNNRRQSIGYITMKVT